MKRIYRHTEHIFEKISSTATSVLGNSIAFMLAIGLVIVWCSHKQFCNQGSYERIKDIMHGIIFLSLFLIQKSFNRFSASLHLKINELVATSDSARNIIINVEDKTEFELIELSKEFADLAEEAKDKEEVN
jgi:low affinity Fe/Cu permease